jgi:hypothetical protein
MLFEDASLSKPVQGSVLWENARYWLDLSDIPTENRRQLIEEARLLAFSDFNARNSVCSFVVSGYVGTLGLGNSNYDVRSRKLSVGDSGDAQFASLLLDIDSILSGLIFRYDGATSRRGQESNRAHQPSLLERLDFFQSVMWGPSPAESLAGAFARISKSPHSKLEQESKEVPASAARRIDVPQLFKTLARRELDLVTNDRLRENRLAVRGREGDAYLPAKVPIKSQRVSFDTAENRFIKFALKDVESVCLGVLADSSYPSLARSDARRLLSETRRLLGDVLFEGVGPLHTLPTHSPVLASNEAYARIYALHLRSRLGVRDPLQEARHQLRSSPLKDIATLYEIWTFFKTATAVLGGDGPILTSSYDSQRLTYGTTWRRGGVAISYNRTFAPPRQSYSVPLRPDITIEAPDTILLLDAKYKSDRAIPADDDDFSETSATVKRVDLHKMHTYVDAIPNAAAALALYPGTEQVLFPRRQSGADPLSDLMASGGVGGLPLVPKALNSELETLANRIRERYLQ